MLEILVLGTVPTGVARDRLAGGGRRIISGSPWLSAQLRAAGIAHRDAERYAAAGWEPLHAASLTTLAALARQATPAPNAVWLDDWTHLLVAELREPRFWEEVARGILRRERPRRVLIQRAPRRSGAAPGLALLRSALEALGTDCRRWPR